MHGTDRTTRLSGAVGAAGVIMTVLSCSHAAESPEVLLAREACRRLVIDYAYYADHPDAERFAALFAEDAVLELGRGPTRGREAIRAKMEATAGRRTARHLLGEPRLEMIDATTARGLTYVQVASGPRAEPGSPAPLEGLGAVGEYEDLFRLTAEGWKIATRTYRTVLYRAPAEKPGP